MEQPIETHPPQFWFNRENKYGKAKRIIKRKSLNQVRDGLNFENVELKVNGVESLFHGSILLDIVFDFLKIPYETYFPNFDMLTEFNDDFYNGLTIWGKIDFEILYFLSIIAEEIFNDKINIRLMHPKRKEGEKPLVFFGSWNDPNLRFTNVSRRIKPNEITELNIKNMDWEKLTKLFPIIKEDRDGRITKYYEGPYGYDNWKDDIGTGYEDGDQLDWLANN